ncbi:MAG: hypothetical protein NY202_05095 [Mollicutes bacterium UO1]
MDVDSIPQSFIKSKSENNANPRDDRIIFDDGDFETWVEKVKLRK